MIRRIAQLKLQRLLIPCALTLLTGAVTLAESEVKAKSKKTGETTEARMDRLEDRLSRLEANLSLLLQKLSDEPSPTAATGEALQLTEDVSTLVADVSAVEGESDAASDTATDQADSAEASASASATGQDPNQAAASSDAVRVPYGGYMEVHLNHDNINPTTLDLHRFVLLYGHQFTDKINFVGEVEIEHALVEGGEASGEIEIEQAYLDFLLTPSMSFRGGMMLVPMGLINERHEPATFNGVERPFVDTVIIPSTWFSLGAGLVGDLGKGFSFKAFTMSPLNAGLFSAQDGFRDGRQKGFLDNATNMAFSGRLEWAGVPNLSLATSYWGGNTAFEFPDISGRTHIVEFDGQYTWNRLDLKGQFAITKLNDAAEINRSLQLVTGVNPNIAEQMRGYYLESAFRPLPSSFPHDMNVFYRFEDFNTQYRMPEGFLPLRQFDRHVHWVGVTYFPHPDIAFKFDYNFMRNASTVVKIPNRWNFGIGWWF